MKKYKCEQHPDEEWIKNKINGHGGGWTFRANNSYSKIDFICGKNKIQIFYYNLILKMRWLKRILNENNNKR